MHVNIGGHLLEKHMTFIFRVSLTWDRSDGFSVQVKPQLSTSQKREDSQVTESPTVELEESGSADTDCVLLASGLIKDKTHPSKSTQYAVVWKLERKYTELLSHE